MGAAGGLGVDESAKDVSPSVPETADKLAPLQQRKRKAEDAIVAAFDTCERACQRERELLRQLEDLAANERAMYEVDHAKDQVMTTLKLALANLVMWTRDHFFPATYAQATWKRLEPFFRLPGRIVWGRDTVWVELRPFNDRRLTRVPLRAVSTSGSRPAPIARWAAVGATGGYGLLPRCSRIAWSGGLPSL